MRRKWLTAGVAVIGLVGVILAGFVWNEARNEIIFLCANFSPGVTEQSVLRQLDTGHFLHYDTTSNTVTASSLFNFNMYECVVEFDQNDLVNLAYVQ